MKKLILDDNDNANHQYIYCSEDLNCLLEDAIVYARAKDDTIYFVDADGNDNYVLTTLGHLSHSCATYNDLKEKYELKVQFIDDIF